METDANVKQLRSVAHAMEENLEATKDVHSLLERHVNKLVEALCKAAVFVTAYRNAKWTAWLVRKMKGGGDNSLVKELIEDIKARWTDLAQMASLEALRAIKWPEAKFVPDPNEVKLRAVLTPRNREKLKTDRKYRAEMEEHLTPSLQVSFVSHAVSSIVSVRNRFSYGEFVGGEPLT